jgi:hypothetical protein
MVWATTGTLKMNEQANDDASSKENNLTLGASGVELKDGAHHSGSKYALSHWLFIRILGAVYLVAFGSLIPQVQGLVGEHGIIPNGLVSDGILIGMPIAGCVASVAVIARFLQLPALIACWLLYFFFTEIGSSFLSFQWDAMLLEAGFLALFPPTMLVIWLLRWLLFRVVFQSGCVKLLSGDPNWWNLSALQYHFWTQPLPTPIGWWVGQLPPDALKGLTLTLLLGEVLIPFLIFAPGRARLTGAILLTLLQFFIAATGNYTFFNLLTAALGILLVPDDFWKRWLRVSPGTSRPLSKLKTVALRIVAGIVIFCTSMQVLEMFVGYRSLPPLAATIVQLVQPLHIANGYGVFAVMTTRRMEIVIEGSNDGETWSAYEFPFKPGDLRRPPPWVAPYQPRLDWQMWFAALGSFQDNPWFIRFMRSLLYAEKPVLSLLSYNPFPDHAPKFIRARGYDYRFTTPEELSRTGCWWKRTDAGMYFPVASLR